MSRAFTKLGAGIWTSEKFRKQDVWARLLLLYYIGGPHQTSVGCFILPDGYATVDLGWSTKRYQTARAALLDADLIAFDPETNEILVRKWFKHNPPMNLDHRKAITAAIDNIVSDRLRVEAAAALAARDAEVLGKLEGKAQTGGLNPVVRLTQTRHMRGRE